MRYWIIIMYFTLIVFVPASLSSAPLSLQPAATISQSNEKAISLVQLSFQDSMAELSRIFDVKIDTSGVSNATPTRFNLNMKHATLERAVKEAIRKAGLQNHALVWDKTGKTLRLLTFESGKPGIISENSADAIWGDMSPLTQEELYLLAQQSASLEAEEAENIKPLSPEQMQQLKEVSATLEAEEAESMKPLTPKQMQQLEEQSAALEAEEAEKMKPLSAGQMRQLKEQSAELEKEFEKSQQPLSKEQILLLQDQENEINSNQINITNEDLNSNQQEKSQTKTLKEE